MIGKSVGSFELVEELGAGGMGTVFKALDVMLEREVAIKMLHRELARQPQVVERFRAEAKVLAKLSHPNVATVYSFFSEKDDLFLVLEYVPGETIAELLQRSGALDWQQAVSLLGGALDGIAQAHSMGIIHRDLKPANLIMTPDGILKVMDFGIARIVGTSHMTRHGHVVGTLEYMSPEQVQGGETDARSDIYSLGVVLYEMLAGRVPFQGGSDFELMKAQIETPPDTPRLFAPDIPEWLEEAVLKALAKKPAERFATVEKLRQTLESGPRPAAAAKATRLAAAPKKTRLAAPREAGPAVPAAVSSATAIVRSWIDTAVARSRKLSWQHWVIAISLGLLVISLLVLMASGNGAEPTAAPADSSPRTGRPPISDVAQTSVDERREDSTPVLPATPIVPPTKRAPITTSPSPSPQPPATEEPEQPTPAPPTASELRLDLFAQRFGELVGLTETIKRDSNALADDAKRFFKRQNRWRPIGRDRELWSEIDELGKAANELTRDLKTAGDKYGVSQDGRARRLMRKARRGVEEIGDFLTGDESDADLAALRRQVSSLDRRAAQVETARRAVQSGGALAAASQRIRSSAARLRQRFP